MLDPRGVSPQSALVDQVVDLGKRPDPKREAYIPAFAFQSNRKSIAEAKNLTVDFEGFSVRGFTGQIQWYSTHHGPSGASLIGTAEVVIAPGGGFAAAVGRETLSFPGSIGMFVRFPLETWESFESQLVELTADYHDVAEDARWLYQAAFPTYFFRGSLAEVPPPGGELITFSSAGGERRGFVMQPRPDGRVLVRYWDHLNGETIWEEIR